MESTNEFIDISWSTIMEQMELYDQYMMSTNG
jgi:hypothetical protein